MGYKLNLLGEDSPYKILRVRKRNGTGVETFRQM